MPNVVVHRYQNPDLADVWEGYVESEDKTWILFIPATGKPTLYDNRDPDTGAVK